MFFQVIRERLAHGLVHRAAHLAVAQLGLGLPFELRLGHLHGNHRREPFAEVLAGDFHLGLFQLLGAGVFGVFLEHAREGCAETGLVRAALLGVDVVHVGMQAFAVARVVHDGALDGRAAFFGVEVYHVVEQRRVVAVEVAHELLHAFLAVERFLQGVPLLVVLAQVGQRDADAPVEVGQLAHTGLERLVFVGGHGEDAAVGPEGLPRARFRRVARAHFLDGVEGFAAGVFLLVHLASAPHLGGHVRGQGVDARHAHAVQSARHLVGVLVELAPGVQHGHHHFQGRFLFLLVHVHGDAAAVVLHGDGVVLVDGHLDVRAVSGHGLVDGVVHHLVHQVVQPVLADVADVHGRAFAHGFQPFQHPDAARAVFGARRYLFLFAHCYNLAC